MLLGLDISTSITGITILDKEGEIIYNDALDTRKYKSMFEKARTLGCVLIFLIGNQNMLPQRQLGSYAASKSLAVKKQNLLF